LPCSAPQTTSGDKLRPVSSSEITVPITGVPVTVSGSVSRWPSGATVPRNSEHDEATASDGQRRSRSDITLPERADSKRRKVVTFP
jgi:hypothetical protein